MSLVPHIGKKPGNIAKYRFRSTEGRFNSLFGFTALKVKLAGFDSACLEGDALVPIRPFLNGETFDPETIRLLGVAFEMARAAVNRPADLSDEMIARTIIERAKAGERNVEVLCEAALNVPAGALSAPNPPPLPLHRRSRRVLHLDLCLRIVSEASRGSFPLGHSPL